MKCVIIESPYAGDVERNVRYARACVHDSLLRGEAPFASHLLYTQPGVLDDLIPEQRMLGINCQLAWMALASLVAVYEDLGITRGMKLGIDFARQNGIPFEVRKLGDWDVESV